MDNIAIAHEHWIEYGGGEYVAEQLARQFDAPLYTGMVTTDTPKGIDVTDVTDHLPFQWLLQRWVMGRDAAYMLTWPNVDLTGYEVIIQSGNNPGWYVPRDDQVIVRYAHTTPRGAYDLYHEHDHGVFGTVAQHAVRTLYQQTVPYPDLWVANSDLVARRIRRYLGVDDSRVRVVYPPVKTSDYDPNESPTDDKLYVTWSRLYEHKNIDQIVKAFAKLGGDYHLIVGGTGPQRDRLKTLAGDNVTFAGWLPETQKHRLASEANAAIFAATNEDFGLVPVEAMAAGTPVIGVRDGYTQHQIRHGKNGLLFDGGPRSIADAVGLINDYGVEWSDQQIAAFARKNYGMKRFHEQMDAAVETAKERATVRVNHAVPEEAPAND